MIMKYRYRSQGPWSDVHFKQASSLTDRPDGSMVATLRFDEDGDTWKDPEFFAVDKKVT